MIRKPPRAPDSVFRARALFISGDLRARATAAELRALRALSRSFRILAAPPADRVLRLAEREGIELHASWLIGEGPDPGFQGALGPSRAPTLGRGLAIVRRAEAASRIIIDPERLARIAASLHGRRRRVVFTNGVFDLLHAGHLSLLERAAALGDVLVVGINSDDSTAAIKGPGRPVVPQFARARLLSSLRFVDQVFIFTEPDPIAVLRILRPETLVKGRDYSGSQVVGARLMRGWGGTVTRLPIVSGASTTATIGSIHAKRRG
jgi:rfaE bifunctional protein nucleotidyltransferase chain/domain